jgi:hypothetical protein
VFPPEIKRGGGYASAEGTNRFLIYLCPLWLHTAIYTTFLLAGEDYRTDREENKSEKSDSDTDASEDDEEKLYDENLQPVETNYVENAGEELGQVRTPSEFLPRDMACKEVDSTQALPYQAVTLQDTSMVFICA